MHIIRSETLGETFGETLGDTFRTRQASPQSLGSDYMQSSPQDSLRDSFFYAGELDICHNRSLFAVSLTQFLAFAAFSNWNFLVFFLIYE